MKNLILVSVVSLGLSGLVAAPAAVADEYGEAVDALCQRVKTCALEQMGNVDDMTPEMKQMIVGKLEGMCVGIQQQYAVGMQHHALYRPATACMRSMAQLTCEVLHSGEEDVTPECADFRQQAAKYE